jgi:TRAP-type C4-dicarboxylate transport system permease small subunit
MMKTAGWLYSKLVMTLMALASLLIVASIAIVIADVLLRATGHKPFAFTVAFTEYILLYFCLLSAPYLVRIKGHVFVDILVRSLAGTPRLIVEKSVYSICIIVALVFAYMGYQIFIEAVQFNYIDERSVDIPYWALYFLFPISFGMVAIEFARFLLGYDSMYERDLPMDSV